MDFVTAATIAQEQGMLLTTDEWVSDARTSQTDLKCFHWNGHEWVGNVQMPADHRRMSCWRVCSSTQARRRLNEQAGSNDEAGL